MRTVVLDQIKRLCSVQCLASDRSQKQMDWKKTINTQQYFLLYILHLSSAQQLMLT